MSEAAKPWYVQAHYNWEATKEGQVPLVRGGIYCVTQELDHGWSLGIDAQNNQGFFPTAYTRRLTAEQEQRLLQRQAQARQQPQQEQQPEQIQEQSQTPQPAQPQPQPAQAQQVQAQPQQAQPAQAQPQQAVQAQAQQPRAVAQPAQAQPAQDARQQASSTDQAGGPAGGVREGESGGSAVAEATVSAAASSEGGEAAGGEADGEEKKKKKTKKHKKKSSKSKGEGESSEAKKEKKEKKHAKKKTSSRSRSKIMSVNSSFALFKQEQLNDTNERRWSVQRLGAREVGDALQQQQLQQQFQKVIEQEYNWQQTLGTVHRDLEAAVATGDAATMQRSLQAFGQAQTNQVKWIGDLCNNLSTRYETQAATIGQQKADVDGLLGKLVALQQGRCFSADPAAFGEARAEEVDQILKEAGVTAGSKEDALDGGVAALREKALGVQRQQSEASKRAQFFQEVDAKGPLASFYAAFSRAFTNVLVGAFSLGDGAASQVSGAGVAAEVQAALRTNVDVGGTSVAVATIARKAVHAWAATSAHDGLAGSLSEEFSHAVAFALVEVYSRVVSQLSLSGAVALAEAAVARMLFLLGQGLVDVTRDPVQQLSHKLSATVTPEQEQNPRPRNTVRIGATELSIPAVLHTQAQVEAILARCSAGAAAAAQGRAWREASVVARAAWTASGEAFVRQGSSEEFGLRLASREGLAFVEELGWYRAPARAAPASASAERGDDGLAAEVAHLKAQLAKQQQEEAEQERTIASLQQQLAALPQLQAALQQQSAALAQLTAEVQQLRQPGAAPPPRQAPQAAPPAAAVAPVARAAPVAAAAPAAAAAAAEELEMFSGDEFDDSLLADAPAEPTPVEKPRAAPLRGSRPTAAAAVATPPPAASAVAAAYTAAASDEDDFNYEDALDELSALAAGLPGDDEDDEDTATASVGSDGEYN